MILRNKKKTTTKKSGVVDLFIERNIPQQLQQQKQRIYDAQQPQNKIHATGQRSKLPLKYVFWLAANQFSKIACKFVILRIYTRQIDRDQNDPILVTINTCLT